MNYTELLNPQNSALILIDFQPQMVFGVASIDRQTLFNNVLLLAKAAKIFKNARAIADAVIPFYGKEASDKLFGVLAGHYGAIKEYMTVSYAGNNAGKDAAVDKIQQNATEIATFLNSANPKNSPKEPLVSLLFAHGGHHIAHINAFNDRSYTAEAQTWQAMNSLCT